MPKTKLHYVCRSCGTSYRQWLGRCNACQEWDSLEEEIVARDDLMVKGANLPAAKPILLSDVSSEEFRRVSSGIGELDRVLGGGIVPGSLVLVGGEPGIGKSTLLLQTAASLSKSGKKVLYVSAEESLSQIRDRAKRIGMLEPSLLLLSESDLTHVESYIAELSPAFVVIDSIQMIFDSNLEGVPGSMVQVRGCAVRLMNLAKRLSISIFLVGHVTKEGSVAGPKILEHIVDTVLYFEGEKSLTYRILRAIKNRFGTVDEVGIFRMQEDGLAGVSNPSEVFLAEKPKGLSGSVIASSLEGSRPIFLEIQALVSRSRLNFPTRRASGIDLNRLGLLIAVLEKRVRIHLEECDVFVSVAGGMKILEPAADLGIAVALASAASGIEVDDSTVMMGEVGLGGEIRHVAGLSRRIAEARNLGFKRCVVPAYRKQNLSLEGIQLIPVSHVEEALKILLKRED
jgi:DNA repair protein RadA/Sms